MSAPNTFAWMKPPWLDPANEPTEERPECVWPWVGDQFLAAVRVKEGSLPWRWEYSVLTINENGDCELDGEPWGWSRDDIEWIARIPKPEKLG